MILEEKEFFRLYIVFVRAKVTCSNKSSLICWPAKTSQLIAKKANVQFQNLFSMIFSAFMKKTYFSRSYFFVDIRNNLAQGEQLTLQNMHAISFLKYPVISIFCFFKTKSRKNVRQVSLNQIIIKHNPKAGFNFTLEGALLAGARFEPMQSWGQ